MKYSKPNLAKIQGKLPPITTNFAPPPVELPEGPDDTSELSLIVKEADSHHNSQDAKDPGEANATE